MKAKFVVVVILSVLVLSLPFARADLTEDDFTTYVPYVSFDYGVTGANLTLSGWVHINCTSGTNTVYSPVASGGYGFGWVTSTTVDGRDRAVGTNVTRDLAHVAGATFANFTLDVSFTYARVTIYAGEMAYEHIGQCYYLENVLVWGSVSTAAGEVKTQAFNVTVGDSQLNFAMNNNLGANTTTTVGLAVEQGIVDYDAWLQYQISQIDLTESLDVTLGVAIIFALTFSVAIGLIMFRRRQDPDQKQQTF